LRTPPRGRQDGVGVILYLQSFDSVRSTDGPFVSSAWSGRQADEADRSGDDNFHDQTSGSIASSDGGVKGRLGLSMCVSLVAGNMIGSGIFLMPASALVPLFTFAILLATFTCLLPYLLSALAEMVVTRRERRSAGRSLARLHLAVAATAFLYAIWAIVGAGREAVGWGLLLLAGGAPVYGLMKRRARRAA
jgi:amino acid transporter